MDYSIKEYSTIYDSLLVAKIKRKTVRQFFLLVLPPEVANLLRKLIQNILPSLIKEFNNEEDPVMNKFFHSKEYDERFLEGPIDNPPLKAEFIFKKTSTSFNKWISQILSENLQIFMNRVHDLSSTKTKEEKPVSTYTEAQNLYDGYLSIRTSAMLLGFGDGNEIEDGTDLISSLAFTIILEAIYPFLPSMRVSFKISPNSVLASFNFASRYFGSALDVCCIVTSVEFNSCILCNQLST